MSQNSGRTTVTDRMDEEFGVERRRSTNKGSNHSQSTTSRGYFELPTVKSVSIAECGYVEPKEC